MVLYWTDYIRYVRRNPRAEKWYDELAWEGAVSDGVLFYYPYSTLVLGVGGIAGLVDGANPPEFVGAVLKVALMAALLIGAVGFTGGFGVPFPWPFVPCWVVDIRKSKTCSKARAQTGQKEGKGRIGLAIFLCRSPLKILAITLEFLQSRSKAIEDGMRRLGPNSALVMYISTEMDP